MGSRARARRAAAMLGFLGLLCAVLGAVMIVMVPTLIKQQVLKVCEGRRPGPAPGRGLEGAQPEARRAAAGIGALVPGPRARRSPEHIARGSWPPPQYPPRPRPRCGAKEASRDFPGGAGQGPEGQNERPPGA